MIGSRILRSRDSKASREEEAYGSSGLPGHDLHSGVSVAGGKGPCLRWWGVKGEGRAIWSLP